MLRIPALVIIQRFNSGDFSVLNFRAKLKSDTKQSLSIIRLQNDCIATYAVGLLNSVFTL